MSPVRFRRGTPVPSDAGRVDVGGVERRLTLSSWKAVLCSVDRSGAFPLFSGFTRREWQSSLATSVPERLYAFLPISDLVMGSDLSEIFVKSVRVKMTIPVSRGVEVVLRDLPCTGPLSVSRSVVQSSFAVDGSLDGVVLLERFVQKGENGVYPLLPEWKPVDSAVSSLRPCRPMKVPMVLKMPMDRRFREVDVLYDYSHRFTRDFPCVICLQIDGSKNFDGLIQSGFGDQLFLQVDLEVEHW